MLSRDDFEKYVTPEELDELRGCVEGGIADYDSLDNYSPTARRDHTKSVRSHIRNAHMNGRAQRLAAASERVRYTPVRGRPLFTVGDRFSISFKKLSPRKLRPRNVPTSQARRFLAQQPLPFDLPTEVTNVVIGYTTDKFETDFQMYVVAPGPTANHWALKLEQQQPDDFFAATPTPAPTPVAPETSKRRVILRSKQGEAKETDANDDVAAQ